MEFGNTSRKKKLRGNKNAVKERTFDDRINIAVHSDERDKWKQAALDQKPEDSKLHTSKVFADWVRRTLNQASKIKNKNP